MAIIDAERERRHIGDDEVFDALVAGNKTGLHGGAKRDDFIGIQAAVRRLAQQLRRRGR